MRHTTSFDYHRPRSIEEACSILLEGGERAALLAGGTDIVIRLKRAIRRVDVIIDLGALDVLHHVVETPEGLHIGSMATDAEIAANAIARQLFPAVTEAAAVVGGLQVRHMATVGGALCSGLRCQYFDQSAFWRGTLSPCVRRGGESCHAQLGSRCVATVACDLPPAIVATGGWVTINGPGGARKLPADELFTGDGARHLSLQPGELVTGVLLPWSHAAPSWWSSYRKVRLRQAVDRPLVGVATSVKRSPQGEIQYLRLSACGNGPSCSLVTGLEPFLGSRLDEAVAAAIGRHVTRWFEPSPAIRVDSRWRRVMAGTMARRTLVDAIHDRSGEVLSEHSVDISTQGRS